VNYPVGEVIQYQWGGCTNGRGLSTTKCWWSRGVWLLRGPIRLGHSTRNSWCVSKYYVALIEGVQYDTLSVECTPVGMIFDEGVFVSSMLFVNYETMSCNVFELLNIVIGLVIIFWVIFYSNYGTLMYFICKKTYGSVSASMPPVYQARIRFMGLIGRSIGFEPFWIQNWVDFNFGRFLPVFTDLSWLIRYWWPPVLSCIRFGEPWFQEALVAFGVPRDIGSPSLFLCVWTCSHGWAHRVIFTN
jgi:hypothetical protein